MEKYLTVNIVMEFLCFLAALIFLRKDVNAVWKTSIIFLLITVVAEEAGRYFNITGQMSSNILIYNLLTIPELLFVSGMFYQILKKNVVNKAIIIGGLIIVSGLYIYELIWFGPYKYMNTTTTVMSVVFSFYGFYYLYLLIKSEEYFELKKHAPFWWGTGSLLYYFGGLASGLLFSVIRLQGHLNNRLYAYIYMALNLLLYIFWSYSFRCRYLQKKSNSLSY